MTGLVRKLSGDEQRAGLAAVVLWLTLLLPWYSTSRIVDGRIEAERLSAFRVFTFVEAAIMLTSAAVLYLLYARAQRRGFHLPGGDGWAITIAGGWVLFLLVWRLFDKPDVQAGPVGVEWGLFVAMVAAGALGAAGQRLRLAGRPEPPNPAEDATWVEPERRPRQRDRRPVDSRAITRTLRDDRPSWSGEPPEAPQPPGGEAPRPRPEGPRDAGNGDPPPRPRDQ